MLSPAWLLCGHMRRSGLPCPWWAGAATPRNRLAPLAHWTGGWPRPPCQARALSWSSFSSVLSSPPASSSSPTSWSSSKWNPQRRRSRTLTPASGTATASKSDSQRWVERLRWGESRNERKKATVVEKIGWCVSCLRWRCWSAQASWLRGSLTQWCPWYRHSGSPTPCLLRPPSFPRCWPSPPPCTTPSSTRWWTWRCPAPVPPAAKPWRTACVLESRGKEVWNVSGNFPNLLL